MDNQQQTHGSALSGKSHVAQTTNVKNKQQSDQAMATVFVYQHALMECILEAYAENDIAMPPEVEDIKDIFFDQLWHKQEDLGANTAADVDRETLSRLAKETPAKLEELLPSIYQALAKYRERLGEDEEEGITSKSRH